MNCFVRDVAYDLPQRTMSSAEVSTLTGADEVFLREKVGISSRHFLDAGETAADMAGRAVDALFARNPQLDRNTIDLLVVVTQNPDFRLPHMGALLQQRCQLSDRVASFDIGLGCSGFVYGLSVVRGFMASEDAKNAILVTADPYSKVINPADRSTMAVFGDAATATWLSTEPGPAAAIVGRTDFGTDGSGAKDLIVATGGSATPLGGIWGNPTNAPVPNPELYMNGRAIFNFLMTRAPQSIHTCLARNKLTMDNIDVFLFHQASKYLLESLIQSMDLPRERAWIDLDDVGNTVSSTIPLTLARRREAGYDLTGKRMLISGFGVGLSWATTVLTF